MELRGEMSLEANAQNDKPNCEPTDRFFTFTASVIFCQKMLTSAKVLKSFTIFQFVHQYVPCGAFASRAVCDTALDQPCPRLMDRPAASSPAPPSPESPSETCRPGGPRDSAAPATPTRAGAPRPGGEGLRGRGSRGEAPARHSPAPAARWQRHGRVPAPRGSPSSSTRSATATPATQQASRM